MTDKKMKKGFTLIEIVIVLAIAALIMVVVFLAVQGAQRSQRDNTRKDVAARVLASATAFQGNNNGIAPTNAAQLQTYLGWTANPTTTNGLVITLTATTGAPAACTPTTGSISISSTTPITVQSCLESTGTNYSINN